MRDDSGNCYAFLLIGTDRVDSHKAKMLMGRKLSVARPEELHDSTSTDPGAVCPLTLHIPLTIDQRVTALQCINFGSGHHLYGIEMKTQDLLRAISHIVADIAETTLKNGGESKPTVCAKKPAV
jgi:prolyl-tRNA editing enzyme YbaK/EbsC (Cys-tRNA(Pro) deacylase)